MTYQTRVNPILYNRLSFALADISDAVDAQVEFVGRHLDQVRSEFAEPGEFHCVDRPPTS